MEEIREFLVLPPREFLVVPELVVRGHDVVEGRHIERVAVDLDQRAVVLEVLRNIRMPVHVAAEDLELAISGIDHVLANRRDIALLERVDRHRLGERLDIRLEVPIRVIGRGRGDAEIGGVDLRVAGHRVRKRAIVGHPSGDQAVPATCDRGALLDRSLTVGKRHGNRPTLAVEPCLERLPDHARADTVGALPGPMPEEHRERAARVERQLGILEVRIEPVNVEGFQDGFRCHPRASGTAHDLNRPLLVQRYRQRRGD